MFESVVLDTINTYASYVIKIDVFSSMSAPGDTHSLRREEAARTWRLIESLSAGFHGLRMRSE
ncbi:hypothetical protein AC628_08140 [Bradyrhizobium sp. NAS96.2]|nr:hypothetical protein AC628_08140 [Bradyrhizobium sp. NAS96.2]